MATSDFGVNDNGRSLTLTGNQMAETFRRWNEKVEQEGWDGPPDPQAQAECFHEIACQVVDEDADAA